MPAKENAKLARYRFLLDLTARLVSTHQVEEVLSALHEQIGTLFPVPVTVLALCLPDGGWQCVTLEGEQRVHAYLPPLPDGLFERALRGELTYTNDINSYIAEHQVQVRRLNPQSTAPMTCSWMGVPLRIEDRWAGVLSIQSYVRHEFTEDDLEFLRFLAIHLGIAIENAHLRERLEREARTDALTHLGNRRSFLHSGERAMQEPGPLSLVVLDLQEFKRINDEFGHPIGDQALATLGGLLSSCALPDGQAFRLGGDEFALLLPEALAQAHQRAEGLLAAAAQTHWPVPIVRLNMGLAECQPGQDFGALVIEADRRMYAAKLRRVQLEPYLSPR